MVIIASCDRADVDFQGKHSDEAFQFHFHQHWIRLIWPSLKLIMWNIILFLIGYFVFSAVGISDAATRHALIVLLTLFFLAAHFEFLTRLYRYYLYTVVVTDKRIHRIKKSLLLVDEHQSLDLWMLQDLYQSQKGLIQNILGYGSIILEAQETILRLHFIPSVKEKSRRLMHLREAARSQMTYSGLMKSPGLG
jgi:hypothetical protein